MLILRPGPKLKVHCGSDRDAMLSTGPVAQMDKRRMQLPSFVRAVLIEQSWLLPPTIATRWLRPGQHHGQGTRRV